jgi:hypothetical protein
MGSKPQESCYACSLLDTNCIVLGQSARFFADCLHVHPDTTRAMQKVAHLQPNSSLCCCNGLACACQSHPVVSSSLHLLDHPEGTHAAAEKSPSGHDDAMNWYRCRSNIFIHANTVYQVTGCPLSSQSFSVTSTEIGSSITNLSIANSKLQVVPA